MSARRPAIPEALVAGSLLVAIGLVSWVLYALQANKEPHSYTSGEAPPTFVSVRTGDTYWISVPGGVSALKRAHIDPASVQCTATAPGLAPGALQVSQESADSKATNQIASFVADFSGSVHIACGRIGPVYVDDAADAPFDWSGVWLVLASITFVVGLPLLLSGLRGWQVPSRSAPASEA